MEELHDIGYRIASNHVSVSQYRIVNRPISSYYFHIIALFGELNTCCPLYYPEGMLGSSGTQ